MDFTIHLEIMDFPAGHGLRRPAAEHLRDLGLAAAAEATPGTEPGTAGGGRGESGDETWEKPRKKWDVHHLNILNMWILDDFFGWFCWIFSR